jgi:hypothetical protein
VPVPVVVVVFEPVALVPVAAVPVVPVPPLPVADVVLPLEWQAVMAIRAGTVKGKRRMPAACRKAGRFRKPADFKPAVARECVQNTS